MKNKAGLPIPQEVIESKILLIRGQKVMLDRDLAKLYGIETRVLNQAVKRNIKRFPEDFMFQLSKEEFENWKSQIVMSKSEKMGLRRRPYAFTEQGVAMLSSVLNSERAIEINIQIMRAFVRLRQVLSIHKEILQKVQEHDRQIKYIFEYLKKYLPAPEKPKQKIGFIVEPIEKDKDVNKLIEEQIKTGEYVETSGEKAVSYLKRRIKKMS